MKILHIITRSELGGAQVVVLNLVKNMPPCYQTMVAAGENGYLQNECERLGIPFHLTPGLIRNINPLQDFVALYEVVKLLRRERPDVVHCHTSKAGFIARVAAWITGIPAVFTAHTWSFDDGMSRLQLLVAVPVERFAARISGPIITVSEANRQKALKKNIAPVDQIIRIWLGIPDSPRRTQLAGRQKVTLIMIARFADQKDQKTLLRALVGMQGNWELLLVGDGPTLEVVKALAAELGLAEQVKFLGERDDVDELLAQSDIFILSTKWEGLPVTILEAMRAGVPVIATNVGGISEMIIDGENGYLTRLADDRNLREKIEAMVHSEDLRVRMGNAARSRYEANFRMEECIEKHVRIYNALIAKTL